MDKKIAFFDIDGVIFNGHSIFDLIRNQEERGFIRKGLWDKILSEIDSYKKGDISYKDAANEMLGQYAAYIKGMSYKDLSEDASEYFGKNRSKFFKYFTQIKPELLKGYNVFLVTTNVRFITAAIAKILGVDDYICSEFEVNKGIFSGKVETTLAGNKNIVGVMLEKYGKKGSIAVGDSENDIDMLKEVELPVAFEPDEKLRGFADTHGWVIVDRHNAYDNILGLL